MSQLANQPPPTKPAQQGETILRTTALRKSFRMGESIIEVLKHVDFAVRGGEFVAIEGRSGSGKSTLLHLMGALDEPNGGSIFYNNRDLADMSGNERSKLRNTQFGFVFQFYHLLPELNVLENTLLAPMIENSWLAFRSKKNELKARAAAVLEQMGLGHRIKHRPNQLSGGERQRV